MRSVLPRAALRRVTSRRIALHVSVFVRARTAQVEVRQVHLRQVRHVKVVAVAR